MQVLFGPILRCSNSLNEDLLMQCAGTLANLSENMENQLSIVEEGGVASLIYLGNQENDEIQQDVARGLANICANEENHVPVFEQGGLNSLIA